MPEGNRPWGSTIFCDDLRQEVDAKRSFIGVYAAVMAIAGEFPTTLPKFAMATTFYEPHELALQRDWEVPVHVVMPGEVFDSAIFRAAVPVAPDNIKEAIRNYHPEPGDQPPFYSRLEFQLIISPFVIMSVGHVRVRAKYQEGEMIRLGAMQIIHAAAIPRI